MIPAACHCGDVRILVPRRPTEGTECNCSICRRYGAMWAYYRHGEVAVQGVPGATRAYLRGPRTIAFHHCVRCGCVTHYETVEPAADSLFALNARAMLPECLDSMVVRQFDGAVSWTYLDGRP